MGTKVNIAKSSASGLQPCASPTPIFLKLFVLATFMEAFVGSIVSAAIWKANRALSIALIALSGVAVGIGAGIQKRKPWTIPATHVLFAIATLFVFLKFLFLGVGANGNDPRAFVNSPANAFSWIMWSLLNVQGAASSISPLVLTLLLAVWIPSYVSLQGQRVRTHFGLPASEVTGKLALAYISLCFLLPIYGLAVPVALYNPDALADTGFSFQFLSSADAWVVVAMTVYGVRAGAELWRSQAGAVRRAERLLAIRFIYSVCFATLLFIVAPNTIADWLLFGDGRYSFLSGMASGVLYVFLRRCLAARETEARIP
jgi:hypothetical protein